MSDNAGSQSLRRQLRRHTIGMVAVECFVDVETVTHWSNGVVIPEFVERRILARIFDIPLNAWLEEPGELVF